jgi:hypothetical protein
MDKRAQLIAEILSKLEVKIGHPDNLLLVRRMMCDDFCENATRYAVYAGFNPDFVLQVIECSYTFKPYGAIWKGMQAAVGYCNLELLKAILAKFGRVERLLHADDDFLLRLALQRGDRYKEIVTFLQQN